jgi:hypothetical protein
VRLHESVCAQMGHLEMRLAMFVIAEMTHLHSAILVLVMHSLAHPVILALHIHILMRMFVLAHALQVPIFKMKLI